MSIDTRLKELIINTLSPEQFEPITPSETEIYLVEDDAEYATVEELATKQDVLIAGANITIENNVISSTGGGGGSYTAGNGIDITDNTISTNTQFVITEDMFDIEYDATKGVAPYNTSYGYTNVTIHDDAGVEWVEGASYTFVLDTKVSNSTYRNVRMRIGEGDWKPLMLTSSVIAGNSVFVKSVNCIFFYKTTYQSNGALHTLYDTNTTYTINYSVDAGQKKAGVGAYAVSRYSLCMQKPDMTWEKITDPTKNYSTTTTKTVNTSGFLLNQIRYYNYTTNYANGALMAANYMYEKSASVNGSYSFNCETAPNWAIGDYIYLVGTVGSDGLFYLDETQWWDNKLPTTNDGKLYIQLGIALTTTDSTFSLYSNRPIYYHDGTSIREYIQGTQTLYEVLKEKSPLIYNAQVFTKVGSPIITNNGIVSNFSNNDYVTIENINLANNFEIQGSFTVGNSFGGLPIELMGSPSGTGYNVRFEIKSSGVGFFFYVNGGWVDNTTFTFALNTEYNYKIVYNGTNISFYLAVKNNPLVNYVDTNWNRYTVTGLNVGSVGGISWGGSIDLKQFSITSNGIEVLNGTLKGTQDIDTWVYWQSGSSGYRYNKRNGYCEQWGITAGGQNETVNLIKTYRDTDYIANYVHYTDVSGDFGQLIFNRTVNSFNLIRKANGAITQKAWTVRGYLAEYGYNESTGGNNWDDIFG